MLIQAASLLFNDPALKVGDEHIQVEALKFAYAGRMRLGDPDFIPNMKSIEDRMVDPRVASELGARINPDRTFPPDYYTSAWAELGEHGTTHVSLLGDDGMAVSATSTVNLEFGSLVLDPETGILLNSEMDDFSIPDNENAFLLPPSEANYIRADKRPQSSCVPMMVEDREGRLLMVIGGTGGSRIVSSVLQVLLLVFRQGLDVYEAVRLPRFHHQLYPNTVKAEYNVPEAVLSHLRSRGHEIQSLTSDAYLAAVGLVSIDRDQYGNQLGVNAVSDPRKGGVAEVF